MPVPGIEPGYVSPKARRCYGWVGETSVEINRKKDELVSLTKQQLIGRIELFEAVPGGPINIPQSSEMELAEKRL